MQIFFLKKPPLVCRDGGVQSNEYFRDYESDFKDFLALNPSHLQLCIHLISKRS